MVIEQKVNPYKIPTTSEGTTNEKINETIKALQKEISYLEKELSINPFGTAKHDLIKSQLAQKSIEYNNALKVYSNKMIYDLFNKKSKDSTNKVKRKYGVTKAIDIGQGLIESNLKSLQNLKKDKRQLVPLKAYKISKEKLAPYGTALQQWEKQINPNKIKGKLIQKGIHLKKYINPNEQKKSKKISDEDYNKAGDAMKEWEEIGKGFQNVGKDVSKTIEDNINKPIANFTNTVQEEGESLFNDIKEGIKGISKATPPKIGTDLQEIDFTTEEEKKKKKKLLEDKNKITKPKNIPKAIRHSTGIIGGNSSNTIRTTPTGIPKQEKKNNGFEIIKGLLGRRN